jgi:hypothetical protein
MKNKQKRIVHIYADYDSAVGEIVLDNSRKGHNNLFDANPKLNQHIFDLCADENVEKVIIHCFSYRQDGLYDSQIANWHANGSAFEQFEYYLADLRMHSDKVHLETMLAEDLFLKEEPGWLWAELKKNQWPHLQKNSLTSYDPRLKSRNWDGDETKITLFFIHAWHTYFTRDPDFEHQIQIFDDKDTIADHISAFNKKNPGLLPPGIPTEFWQYWHHINNEGHETRYDCFKREQLTLHNVADHTVKPFDLHAAVKKLLGLLNLGRSNTLNMSQCPESLTIEALVPAINQTKAPLYFSEQKIQAENQETNVVEVSPRNGCYQALLYLFQSCMGQPRLNTVELNEDKTGLSQRLN